MQKSSTRLRGVSETPIQVRERNGLENHGSGQKWRCTMYYVPPILEVVTCPADRICHVYTHMTCVAKRHIYTGFYERSHGDTIEFRPENLRVCLDYLYEWTCQILVKSADQFLSN